MEEYHVESKVNSNCFGVKFYRRGLASNGSAKIVSNAINIMTNCKCAHFNIFLCRRKPMPQDEPP